MSSRFTRVSGFAAATLAATALAVTMTHAGHAQTPRTMTPAPRPLMRPATIDAASPKLQLIQWGVGRATPLAGLINATGPGGVPLPNAEQIRTSARIRTKPPGTVSITTQAGSPAAVALAHLGRCMPPACQIEIRELGPTGQVLGSHTFSGGTATEQNHTNELEEFSLTFQKITYANVDSSKSATDDWLTP